MSQLFANELNTWLEIHYHAMSCSEENNKYNGWTTSTVTDLQQGI